MNSQTMQRPGYTAVKKDWRVFAQNAKQNPHIDEACKFLDSIEIPYRLTDNGLELVETAYVAQPGDGAKDFAFAGTLTIGASDRDKLQMILAGKGHLAKSWKQKVAESETKIARAAERAAHGRPIDAADAIEQAERQIAGITDPVMKAQMLRALAERVEAQSAPAAPPAPAPTPEPPQEKAGK